MLALIMEKQLSYFLKDLCLINSIVLKQAPINFDVLKKNIKDLNFKNKYYLNNIGLGYEDGKGFINHTDETSPLQLTILILIRNI